MKKLMLLILMAGFFMAGYAQNKNVVSAYNYLKRDRLDKAKEAIDPATTHEKTMNDPKTWFYSGNVYLQIHLSEDPAYKELHPNPLPKALSDYQRALELDEKETYSKELNEKILITASQFFDMGVIAYNNQDYGKSSEAFAAAAQITRGYNVIDTVAMFYAGQGAYLSDNYDKAAKFFGELMDINYNEPGLYRMMADIQKSQGDTTLSITTINKGRKLFPGDFNLIVDAANIYLATGQNEEALDVLTLAMQQDATNPTLFFAAATIYDKLQNREKAAELYANAIKLDPEYFDANYNLGALYYNRAAEIVLEAASLPLNETKKYDVLLAEGNELMKKSLPYLEKADEIQPGDPTTTQTLKEIYVRLNMLEKLKGINERLNE